MVNLPLKQKGKEQTPQVKLSPEKGGERPRESSAPTRGTHSRAVKGVVLLPTRNKPNIGL